MTLDKLTEELYNKIDKLVCEYLNEYNEQKKYTFTLEEMTDILRELSLIKDAYFIWKINPSQPINYTPIYERALNIEKKLRGDEVRADLRS